MVRRHLFLLFVLALAVAAVIVPESRGVVGAEIEGLVSFRAYPYGSLMRRVWDGDAKGALHDADVSLETDWETHVARAQLDTSGAREHSAKAIAAGRNRPETYAAAIIASCKEAVYDRPNEEDVRLYRGSPGKRKDLDPEFGWHLLDSCDIGSRLDPDNAFFDLMAANALFGMRRDALALERMLSASRKRHYESYRSAACLATVKYLRAFRLWKHVPLCLAFSSRTANA